MQLGHCVCVINVCLHIWYELVCMWEWVWTGQSTYLEVTEYPQISVFTVHLVWDRSPCCSNCIWQAKFQWAFENFLVSLGIKDECLALHGFWGFEFRFLCLWVKYFININIYYSMCVSTMKAEGWCLQREKESMGDWKRPAEKKGH